MIEMSWNHSSVHVASTSGEPPFPFVRHHTNPTRHSYRFSHIAKTLRALQSSTKTSLRIDDEGLLSLQFMMPSPKARGPDSEGPQAFIDFYCLPLDEEVV